MKDILSLIQENPRVSTEVIHITLQSIKEFQLSIFWTSDTGRALLFLGRNPDFSSLPYDQAVVLTVDSRHIAAQEMTDQNDPFIRPNVSAMSCRIMSEDSATWWKALTLRCLSSSSQVDDIRKGEFETTINGTSVSNKVIFQQPQEWSTGLAHVLLVQHDQPTIKTLLCNLKNQMIDRIHVGRIMYIHSSSGLDNLNQNGKMTMHDPQSLVSCACYNAIGVKEKQPGWEHHWRHWQ
jgi:hypothetical protein